MIRIRNMRDPEYKGYKEQFRVDRASCLGNPYKMEEQTEEERARVCEIYKTHFKEVLLNIPEVKEYLDKMVNFIEQTGKIELWCWCAPKQCHAETIKEYLLSVVDIDVVNKGIKDRLEKGKELYAGCE